MIGSFVALLAPSRCVACDQETDKVFCRTCSVLLEPHDGPSAVFHYGGPIADAIHRFKYQGRSDLGRALGSLMTAHATRQTRRIDAIVPVPLHWRRRRSRGYDQAALLALAVAKSLGVPARLRGLRRTRPTRSQVDLAYRDRQCNVAGAFAVTHLHGAQRVLLIDDVRTTGATLRAATTALVTAGAREVHPLVLAARVLSEGT